MNSQSSSDGGFNAKVASEYSDYRAECDLIKMRCRYFRM